MDHGGLQHMERTEGISSISRYLSLQNLIHRSQMYIKEFSFPVCIKLLAKWYRTGKNYAEWDVCIFQVLIIILTHSVAKPEEE